MTSDLRPGDTVPGMCAAELAALAPPGLSNVERAAFVAAAQDATVDVDSSGDLYYDRLCSRLEARLLTMAGDRLAEADAWWRYRLAKRMARPSTVDDPETPRQMAAEAPTRVEGP